MWVSEGHSVCCVEFCGEDCCADCVWGEGLDCVFDSGLLLGPFVDVFFGRYFVFEYEATGYAVECVEFLIVRLRDAVDIDEEGCGLCKVGWGALWGWCVLREWFPVVGVFDCVVDVVVVFDRLFEGLDSEERAKVCGFGGLFFAYGEHGDEGAVHEDWGEAVAFDSRGSFGVDVVAGDLEREEVGWDLGGGVVSVWEHWEVWGGGCWGWHGCGRGCGRGCGHHVGVGVTGGLGWGCIVEGCEGPVWLDDHVGASGDGWCWGVLHGLRGWICLLGARGSGCCFIEFLWLLGVAFDVNRRGFWFFFCI